MARTYQKEKTTMAEEELKAFDEYTDDFQFDMGAYGLTVTLRRNMTVSGGGNAVGPVFGRLRMSMEHAKMLTFRLHQMIQGVEKEHAIAYPISGKMLNIMRIKEEDWELFWRA